MTRPSDILLAGVLILMIAVVGLIGPDRITQTALSVLHWTPVKVTEALQVQTGPHIPREYVEQIREPDVRATLTHFASLPSRVVGYPGIEQAYKTVRSAFEDIGLKDITTETFKVTVPIDKGAHLTLNDTGEQIPLYCLWPNQVKTPSLPPEGITSHLIYGGKGDFRELNGKVVEGSIVLMDFDCDQKYINPRMLGAQAVIFFDNGGINQDQASDKFLSVPADIPRYWVDKEEARRLLNLTASGDHRVTLHAKMDWEDVEAKNIYGVLPGLDEEMPAGERGDRGRWKDHLIVVEAYYDAMSVVPGIAPGAENACGITGLLHVARLLKEYGTRYSILFLATSAHFEGLSGVNDFLYRHARKSSYFRERMAPEDQLDFQLFIGLDLSSHNDRVATFTMGTFYNSGWGTNNYQKNMMAPYAKAFTRYAEEIFPGEERHIDAIAPSKRTWKNFMPVRIGLDSEAAIFVGLSGISFVTPDDVREKVDTPADRLKEVDTAALTRQIQTIAGILLKAVHDPDLFGDTSLELKDQGHELEGTVYWFNRDVNFAVPQDPVPGAVVTYQQPGPNSVSGVRTLIVTRTGTEGKEKGRFRFDILRNAWSNKILAYQLDEYGNIISAPDLGSDGNASFPITQKYVWWKDEMIEVLFPCRALSLFEIVDSRHLSTLDYLTVLGADDSPLQWYGSDYIAQQSQKEGKTTPAAVVYAKPGTRVKVLMSTGLFGIKYLLTHAPEDLFDAPISPSQATPEVLERAKGTGYRVDQGVLFRPSYRTAVDMWIIDDVRMKMLARYGVRNEKLFRLHQEAQDALKEARSCWAARDYEGFIAATRRASGLENRGYPDVKATANDTVKGIIFYFVLLLPFSFFCERLLFGFSDIRKRIAGFALIFVLIFLILRWVHPAFKLSNSPYIIFLAFVIFAMGAVVIIIISSKFKQEMGKMKQAASGVLEADVGRLSATAAAIALGISNLRKRKMRTGLTAVTLILVSFTVLSFTSFRTSLKFYRLPRGNRPPYQGALLRDRSWRGLQPVALDYVQSAFRDRALIVPRAWYLSQSKGEQAYIRFEASWIASSTGPRSDHLSRSNTSIGVLNLKQTRTSKASFANALLGMTSDEPRVTSIDTLLIGSSRWFRQGERNVCILPTDMAQLVGITEADIGNASIRMLGSTFQVVGLIDAEKFNRVRGMDDEKLTPVDTVSEAAKMSKEARQDPRRIARAPFQTFTHLESSNVIILPYPDVLEIGGTLQSIAIVDFPKPDFTEDIEAFVSRTALPIFVGQGDKITVYSSMGATSISGLSNLLIPILIGALIVLNTMMGSVYERFKEIGIYSSVGLAPIHIAALFMAEAAVFATIGAVVGYLIGQITALALSSMGALGGISLNYSSLSAVSSTLIVMVTVFLSTLYPAKKAANMAVPDVTRKWTFPEPKGDRWEFDFPFTVGGAEVLGLYSYLTHVFESYGESSIGDFLTEDVTFSAFGSEAPGESGYTIALKVWLAPYDLGISQEVHLNALPTGEHHIYRVAMTIQRLSGDVASWRRINRGFLNVLRKRFLVWRTIPPPLKADYAERGRGIIEGVQVG